MSWEDLSTCRFRYKDGHCAGLSTTRGSAGKRDGMRFIRCCTHGSCLFHDFRLGWWYRVTVSILRACAAGADDEELAWDSARR